ncbi:MAG: 50S ribosomal protein L6 [Deltaproteobacteria bacterium]|nr:50S ribosomal protein L6 [Deltaproteobacteria bacterium]MCL5791687.1 50S ribosomal protein L6 [Deltaproteobacteria bacterium]
MSKLARKPIVIPKGVKVEFENNTVKLTGVKGVIEKLIPEPIKLIITSENIKVDMADKEETNTSLQGTITALLKNMLKGVAEGFKKDLELVGVGYKAELKNRELILNIGYTKPVVMNVPQGLNINIEKQTKISVAGVDKQLLGLWCAKVKSVRPPDAYKGKGIKFADEVLKLKPGKTAATAEAKT